MRKILYMLAAVLTLASCGDRNGGQNGNKTELTLEQKLYGQWHSTSVAIDADIYMSFAEDGTFELYQQIGEGAYRLYRGSWNLEESLLTGKYNDGEDWAAGYEVSIEGSTLSLTSVNDAAEESLYEKSEIPERVKEGCVVEVKSFTSTPAL